MISHAKQPPGSQFKVCTFDFEVKVGKFSRKLTQRQGQVCIPTVRLSDEQS